MTETKTKASTLSAVQRGNVSDLSFTFIDDEKEKIDNNPVSSDRTVTDNAIENPKGCDLTDTDIRPTLVVGDNRGLSSQAYSPPNEVNVSPSLGESIPPPSHLCPHHLHSSQEDPWHLTFNELKEMRVRMGSLEKVEAATLDFAKQLQAILQKTTNTDKNVSVNTDKIKAMEEEISKLKLTVENQQCTIQGLQKMKDDFKKISHKNVSEMNKLVEQQKNQVEAIRTLKKEIKSDVKVQKEQIDTLLTTQDSKQQHLQQQITQTKADIQAQRDQVDTLQTSQDLKQAHLQQQITQAKEEADHKTLLDEVFKKRHNIIITGLPEQEPLTSFSVVLQFLKNQLKLRRLQIDSVIRIGHASTDNQSYIRPLLVRFYNLADRNLVWRRRHNIQQTEDQPRVKIQADLPKKLRDDVNILYRVVRAASGIEEFKSAVVKDFSVFLHGKQYTADNLELLPPPIRPSSLAVRESEEALVFYSRFSFLSNHFPSKFEINGLTFYNMEHYLAFKKAELSQNEDLIQWALQARDPLEAKSILNLLRKDLSQDWERVREEVATIGIREKFGQQPYLADLLRDTRHLTLGEASRDPAWGIGFTFEDQHVLEVQKWNEQGNLLGKILMRIRDELSTFNNK